MICGARNILAVVRGTATEVPEVSGLAEGSGDAGLFRVVVGAGFSASEE